MKYVIEKNGKDMKLVYYSVNMVGLGVEPKNGVPGLTIKAKKIVLVDSKLRDAYIKQRINKKIDKVIKFMLRILNDEDTTEGDVGMVLDEINKLNPRDREIIVLRYGLINGEEMTQKDVAELLGISQSYISRIEKKVIKRIKNIVNS